MAENIKIWNIEEPWVNPHCVLSEGPYHEKSSDRLRFIDISKNQVLWIDPKEGPSSLKVLDVKEPIGVTADIEGDDDNIIVGGKYGFAYMNKTTGALDYLTKPSQFWTQSHEDVNSKPQRMRFNDGNIDPQGRFWCGMINDTVYHPFSPEGALFRLSTDGQSIDRMVENVTIANGIGWSPDEKTMYFTDSPKRAIVAYDFDRSTGDISNARTWYDLRVDEGEGPYPVPDGFCQDAEDCFWVAFYGGSKVVRLRDRDGKAEKIGEVRLPTSRITCPRIVGTTLWITTGEEGDNCTDESAKEFGGGLFAVDVGVRAKEDTKWKRP